MKRLNYIFTTLLLIVALQAAGQGSVIDSVCVGSNRHYRIDGEKLSTYLWVLYDDLTGNTITLTNSAGTPFAETSPEKYGSELEITWNQPGVFRLEAIQFSEFLCDTLQQGIIKVFDHPEVFPGNPVAICAGVPVLLSEATASNYSLLIWSTSTSGDGTFSSTTELNPLYTPGPNDILAGTVTLTLTAEGMGDPGSCTVAVGTVTITISNMELLASATPLLCFEGGDGIARVDVTGAIGTTTFAWTGPNGFTSHQQEITGLAAGTYSVTVTDFIGCTATASVTVVEPTPLTASVAGVDSGCFGGNDGEATVSVSGGTASYTYQWNDPAAQTTPTATGLTAGIYMVTATDANGCTVTASVTIGEAPLLTATITAADVSCFGGNDGSATVNVTGGTASYTYQWDDPASQITATATSLISGNYVVTVTDANGCTATASVTIGQPDQLTATVTGTDVNCSGGNDGTATVVASGGTASYTYVWSDLLNQTTATASGLTVGTYSVTVTDAQGCTATASVTLAEPAPLTASATGTPALCFEGNDGTATVIVSGGTASYTYLWSDPLAQTTATATGLAAGIYTVTVTDQNNCQATATVTIGEPTPIVITEVHEDSKCSGKKPGWINITVSGGTPGYVYSWTSTNGFVATTEDITDLAGTASYTITVTDANGCTATRNIYIDEEKNMTLAETHENVKCFGGSDGSIDLEVKGGKKDYTYVWTNLADLTTVIATTEDVANLPAGVYRVTVTDANDCTETLEITLTEPVLLVASATGTNINCFGGNDGTATVVASGGTGAYTYLWSDPLAQNTATAVNLTMGTYTVTVTDVNGCTVSASVILTEPTLLAATVTGTEVQCFGGNDGSATVTATGGTGTYTYLWNDPAAQTTATATGLIAGTYQVMVTDANGCTTSVSVTITQPAVPLTASATGTNVQCFGGNDGAATASVSGGTTPYTYLWNDPLAQTSLNASGLIAGSYLLTVTDANDCTTSVSVTITQPEELTATVTGTEAKCFGAADGTATVTPTGGTAPYTYLWNDLATQTTATASGLIAGTYQVIVTDTHGCTTTETITIDEPAAPLTASAVGADANCFGGNDGQATVAANGGTAPYTYLWNDPTAQTTAIATGLAAGTYTVTVTDANGCTGTASVTIGQPTELTATISGTDLKCFGGTDGTATVVADEGTAPYTYLWNDLAAQTTAIATGLTAGTYQVVVTDAHGCTLTSSVTLNEPAASLTAAITGVDVKCFDGSDGSASVVASGGTSPYFYLWNDPSTQTGTTASGLKAGTYEVVVTDANGCTTSASITITEPLELQASATGTDVNCFNGNDGTATVLATGGTSPYLYLWDDPTAQTGTTASGLKAGTYQVTVTDANGCTASASVIIGEPTELTATLTSTDVNCFGGNDGTATVAVSGGTVSYTYAWNDPATQTSATASGLAAGIYQVTVTDANGCTLTTSVTINEPANALVASVVGTDVLCFGGSDGTASVTVSGGTAPYNYLWNDPSAQTSTTASNLKAGVYEVMVTDANGCTVTASITINEPPALVALVSKTDVNCFGGNDGSATVAVSGGTLTYVYLWNDPLAQTTPTATGLVAGVYLVNVTDSNGCTTSATVTITQPASELLATISGTNVTCFGSNDGTGTAAVSGGTAPYSYLWNDPMAQTGAMATGLTAGVYQVRVTDANGCTTSASVTITEPVQLAATTTSTDVKCFGGNDGSATVSVTGGTPNYTYLWNDALAQTSPTATGLYAGTYQVRVTDANGCTLTSSVTITEPAENLDAIVSGTDVNCFGGNDGSATVAVSGGTAPYFYLWNDALGQTGITATGLTAGNYEVTVTDANGCTTSATITINEPLLALTATVAGTDVSCFGGSDGIAVATVSGGTASYTFLWNDPSAQTTQTAVGLTAGTYLVSVTDANGCTTSASVTISEPPVLAATAVGTDVSCFGGNDGTATVSASGGTANYTYLWNDALAQTTATATGLTAGVYQVTVTDAKGCSVNASITIDEPNLPLAATIAGTNVNCFGGNDGSATVSVSGGTATYTYLWNDALAQTTATASGLIAGVYQVLVTDANGCTTSSVITITEPAADLTASVLGIDVKCFGGNDGSATVSVLGGTSGYTYLWNDAVAQTTATATGLIAGTYQVSVTDANGCTTSASVSISQPASIPTSTTDLIVCENLLPFNWNGNNYTSGGTYSVTLTTKLGCDSIAVLNLEIEIPKVPAFAAIGPLCLNSVAPALPLASTNGYTGTWSPSVISTTTVGTTTYTFTPDAGQCATTATLTIEIIPPEVPLFAAIDPLCINTPAPALPSVSLNGIPGTWSPAIVSTAATGTTVYTFTPDAGQCATTASITIEVTEPLAFAGNPVTICPENTFTLSEATAAFYSSLQWSSSGDGTFDNATLLQPTYTPGANDLLAGTVTLTITAQGLGSSPDCVPAVSSMVLTIIKLQANVTSSDVNCYGANNGSITITELTGGSGNYQYNINNGTGWGTLTQFVNLPPGIYKVEMRDLLIPQCVKLLANIEILEPDPLTATVEPQNATCLGNDGSISVVSPDGGSGSYEYSMNGGAWTTTGYFPNLVPGVYLIEMRDLNVPDCKETLGSFTIEMPLPVTAKVDKIDVTCYSGNDGRILISEPENGSGFYEFSIGGTWITGMEFNNLIAGTYTVRMRDLNAAACVETIATITITDPTQLTANVVPKDITCFGSNDGSISIQNPSGGSGGWEFSIDGSTWSATTTFANLGAGTYFVLMRDVNATKCVVSLGNFVITEPLQLTALVASENISCFGANDGKITISEPKNGTPGYTFTIDGTIWTTALSFTGLGPNTYTVQMRDANGCTEPLGTIQIIEPKPLTAVVDHTNATCLGNDGTITISNPENSVSGLYEFSINGGGTWTSTLLFTGLSSNTYTVKVRDANLPSCEQTIETIIVTEPEPMLATAESTDVTCFNANDGTITVKDQEGGSTLYQYSINNVDWFNQPVFKGLAPADYTVWMRDRNAPECFIEVGKLTITQPDQLVATIVSFDVTCYGANDGYIDLINPAGGSGNFDYSVDGINWTSGRIDNLIAGFYTVQMRDADVVSCIVSLGQVEIKQPEKLFAKVVPTDVTCFDGNDGSITLSEPTNGVGPYQFSIDGGLTWQPEMVFTGLKADNYTLLVIQDANNCIATLDPVTIDQPDQLEAALQHTNETLPDADDGTITVTAQKGGSGVYEYSKDGVIWQTSAVFTGLAPGAYTIWVRDGAANANDCMISLSVDILPAGSITALYDKTNVTCFGGSDGSITFRNPTGASNYQYSVNGGASWGLVNQLVFSGLNAQSYTLSVRDADNSSNSSPLGSIEITQPAQLEAVVTVTAESFAGANDGALTISGLAGGSGAYEYSIDGADWRATPLFPGLTSGNYTVQVRDRNAPGCFISIPRLIQPAGALNADISYTNIKCFGDNDGSIIITNATGATSFEYSHNGGANWQSAGVFSGLALGNYEVMIRDAATPANQVSLGSIAITQPSQLFASFGNYTPPICTGTSGSFTISGFGGTPPYTGTGTFVLPSGASRRYTIMDRNGCTAFIDVSMPDPPKITATAVLNPPKCFGENGTITISATGGTGVLNGQGTFVVQAGKSYNFRVTDANGCSSNIISGIMPPVEVLALQITPVSSLCLGGSATVTVSATGGVPDYIGTGTFNVPIGTHTFTVTDAAGCVATASIIIAVKDPPAAPVLSATDPNCYLPTATLKVESPLGANYLYSFDGGAYSSVITFANLDPGSTHTVTVKDVTTGCESLVTTKIINLIPAPPAAPTVTVIQPTCIVATGSIVVTEPKAGTGFLYRLDGGAFTTVTTFANLAPGSTHTVTVSEILTGCVSSPTVRTIDLLPVNPPAPVAKIAVNPTCDNPDGTVEVTSPLSSPGTDYAYSIDGGLTYQASVVFDKLVTGTYTITVKNIQTECISSGSVIVPAIPPAPVLSLASFENPKCYGDTYTITLTMTNTPDDNYTFWYEGGSFTNVAVLAGTATITGSFTEPYKTFNKLTFVANGCTSSGTVNIRIDNPDQLNVVIVKVTEHALKGVLGSIDIRVDGGTTTVPGVYSYLWSNEATTQDLNPISFGTYTVTVWDANNCIALKQVRVPLNNPPVAVADDYLFSCLVLTGDLLENDYDPDPVEQNDFITINTVPVVAPANAQSFKINSNGTFEYLATTGFTGTDTFIYEIYDKFGQTATATVTIVVVSDTDHDGVADAIDPDADGDGILNVLEGYPDRDTDGDGIPDWLDIDSDNDGIVDNIEAQSWDDYVPPMYKDTDGDGLDDAYDPDQNGKTIVPVDTDGDGIPDYIDFDSDNDGVPDYIEGHDLNADGKPDTRITGKDSDGDGLDDAFDTVENLCEVDGNVTGSNAPMQDFDGDGIPDWRDDDDDNDGYPTRNEDLNADGDWSNDDMDYDGHPEYLDYGRDCDLFIPNAFSPNDDNIHDYFQIYCINHFPNAKMYIFDQLGNKLFEKENYGNLDFWGTPENAWWDGKTTNRSATTYNGKVAPGTYYYVLRLGNGEVKKSFVFVSY